MNEKAGKLIAGFLAKYANLENARNLLFDIVQSAEGENNAPDLTRLNIAAEQTPGTVADIIHAYIVISPWLMADRILLAYDCCQTKADKHWNIEKENAIAFGVLLGIFDALADIDAATHIYNVLEEDATEAECKIADDLVSKFSTLISRLTTEPHGIISAQRRADYYAQQFDMPRQSAGTQFHAAKFFEDFKERFEKNVRKATAQILKLDTTDFLGSLQILSLAHTNKLPEKQPFIVDMILRNIGYALLKELDGIDIAFAGRQALINKRHT